MIIVELNGPFQKPLTLGIYSIEYCTINLDIFPWEWFHS